MTVADQTEPPVLQMHNGYEIYPMPMFAALETADANALARWYEAALGFGVMFKGPERDGQPMVIHLRRHKYQDILIRPSRSEETLTVIDGLSLCFQAGETVDRIAASAIAVPAVGKARVEAAGDTPWNTRQVRIVDPDGRMLIFSQPRFDPEQTKRMQEWFESDKARGA